MRTISRPLCVVCGARGAMLHAGLDDRLYSTPGRWDLMRCEAPGCGTLWLDPAPLPEDLGEAYANYFTHERKGAPRLSGLKRIYLETTFGRPSAAGVGRRLAAFLFALRYRRRLEADNQICHLDIETMGMKVLDLGCGDGAMMWALRELGCEVIGVEFDAAAAARGREHGLDIRHGSLDEQRFPTASFDAVILSHVIEHLPDPAATLREILRVLRPDGQLRMLTPNAAAWGHAHFGRNWFALDPPRHLNIFTPASMTALVRQAGFADVSVPTTATGADRIAAFSRRIRDSGRAGMEDRFGWTDKRYGRLFQMLETLVNLGGRGVASQLVAKARKPRD